jgi:hypothetical protein
MDFYLDDVDIAEFFYEFYDDDRKRTTEESKEKIVMQVLWKEDCDDGKKSDVYKNSLDSGNRFSCVFEVVAWFVEDA